jgi:hypothetical protein
MTGGPHLSAAAGEGVRMQAVLDRKADRAADKWGRLANWDR